MESVVLSSESEEDNRDRKQIFFDSSSDEKIWQGILNANQGSQEENPLRKKALGIGQENELRQLRSNNDTQGIWSQGNDERKAKTLVMEEVDAIRQVLDGPFAKRLKTLRKSLIYEGANTNEKPDESLSAETKDVC